ncbi:MAG: hypothetical protein ACYC6G_00585 [Desulfobaccales bacterium]
MEIVQVMSRVLESALVRSRRSSFVKQYLYLLWPASEGLLLELARRLGDETSLPGTPVSLLAGSLAEGAENFYRRKGRYSAATWDQNVFLHFFQGMFCRAAAVFGCQVRTPDGGCWEVEHSPYLDWRLENPGGIEVCWQPEASPGDRAGELCRLVLAGCNYPGTWAVGQLLQLLDGEPQ